MFRLVREISMNLPKRKKNRSAMIMKMLTLISWTMMKGRKEMRPRMKSLKNKQNNRRR